MISHDMSYHSDYTTAKRRRLIEKIRNEISAGDWGKENGPWIGPSQNVYAIDVYHNAEVHGEIVDLRNSAAQAKRPSSDKEVDKLPTEFFYAFQKKDLAKQTQIVKRLRELYAYKSVSKRLEYEKANDLPDPVLTAASVKRLQDREQRVNPKSKRYFSFTQVRGESLRLLHEEQVQDFVKREGFGLSRMPQPSPSQLRLLPLPSVPLASAEISTSIGEIPVRLPKTSANRAASAVSMPTEDMLALFHTYSQDKFLDPRGFGYVKDRDHVAGFSAHAFSYKPQWRWVDNREWYVPKEHWAIHRMELVSLLKFTKPAVYVSANLPNMQELDDTQTRPLDLFESDALSRLQKGEDLVPQATTNRIRMLGSLRADKQCLECHDVKRGHLLGAFSYVLLRDPALGLQE
ncbi:MAG: hypothetical protein IH991_08735 [Planctomycetes bacterium]|nr:hypothetical protein [Planctomycetota bacterium]